MSFLIVLTYVYGEILSYSRFVVFVFLYLSLFDKWHEERYKKNENKTELGMFLLNVDDLYILELQFATLGQTSF